MRTTRGFTLIELLVVIAIIGLLSSIVLASLGTTRAKARDSERLQELREVTNALELYYSKNKSYPCTGGTNGSSCTSGVTWYGVCNGKDTSGATGWVPDLAPEFIGQLPTDPRPATNPTPHNGCYLYVSNGKDYMILANGTVESYATAAGNPRPRPIRDGDLDTCPAVPNTDVYVPSFAYYTRGYECQ